MKAEEMRLAPMLGGHKQFVVPYFQRVYSWRSQQWTTLFDDIVELYELGAGHTHFLGSMVLLAERGSDGPKPTGDRRPATPGHPVPVPGRDP